jgi:putative PIN family toxin of toxin-antitoxin system
MRRVFVLDTSVIVAAFRSPLGASRQILLAALNQKFQLLLSVPLLLEYEAVLTRPEHLAASKIKASEIEMVLNDLISVAKPVRLAFRWRPKLADPADDMVLETAANGGAKAIVTFNLRHFAGVATTFGIRVMSPAAALEDLGGMNS